MSCPPPNQSMPLYGVLAETLGRDCSGAGNVRRQFLSRAPVAGFWVCAPPKSVAGAGAGCRVSLWFLMVAFCIVPSFTVPYFIVTLLLVAFSHCGLFHGGLCTVALFIVASFLVASSTMAFLIEVFWRALFTFGTSARDRNRRRTFPTPSQPLHNASSDWGIFKKQPR